MKKLSKEELEKIKFINLNTHTHFSIPMGVGDPKDLIKRSLECGHTGFSITDVNTMGGVLKAYKLVKDKDFLKKIGRKDKVPFVVGCELNLIDDLSKRDRVNKYFNITVFATSLVGYENLCYLTSIGSRPDHFYNRPRISLPELLEHNEGLIVTSGNIDGMISQAILKETGQEDLLVEIFKEYFGDRFFLQMHFHPRSQQWVKELKMYQEQPVDPQKIVNLKLVELSRRHGVKCFLTQNSYIPDSTDKLQQDILIGNHPFGKEGWKFSEAYYLMGVEEMYEYIQKNSSYISDEQFVEWCANTQLIQDMCKSLALSFAPQLPDIRYDESEVNKDPKWDAAYDELEAFLKEFSPPLAHYFSVGHKDIALKTTLKIIMKNEKVDFKRHEVCDRLAVELLVIARNGIINLCDYFLLLEDVTHFVRENGYLRGFGRGSGAGSLVAYALDITDCDPLVFNLLFERFLTKERVGAMNFEFPGYAMKDVLARK